MRTILRALFFVMVLLSAVAAVVQSINDSDPSLRKVAHPPFKFDPTRPPGKQWYILEEWDR
jgi:hypothetical protein